MDYAFLAIRSGEEDDAGLYPAIFDDGSVRPEDLDGACFSVAGTGLKVRETVIGGSKTLAELSDTRLTIVVTESRVVVTCKKWDKGGGWIGFGLGAAFALAANGVSKARAANRRRGKTLVGQVRYPWLRCVGFTKKTGWLSDEKVRLGVTVRAHDGTDRVLYLDVTLRKQEDAAEVARQVAMRGARYRLTHTRDLATGDRMRYDELAAGPYLPAEKDAFAMYQMPRFFFVSPASAYPAQAAVVAGVG